MTMRVYQLDLSDASQDSIGCTLDEYCQVLFGQICLLHVWCHVSDACVELVCWFKGNHLVLAILVFVDGVSGADLVECVVEVSTDRNNTTVLSH